jgi:hypothetical protein
MDALVESTGVVRAAFIDHLTIPVRDVAASRRFYEAALAAFDIETAEIEGAVGFGPSGSADFFVREGEPAAPLHLPLPRLTARPSMRSTPLLWPRAAVTTARLVFVRATTPTITAGMSLTRMATTLRLSATTRSHRGQRPIVQNAIREPSGDHAWPPVDALRCKQDGRKAAGLSQDRV